MKVLHILNSHRLSGAENVAISIIEGLENQYSFAYTSPNGQINESLKEREITFIPMKSKRVKHSELLRIIDDYKPDIIHAHGFRAGLISSMLKTNIPIICHMHNTKPWLKNIGVKSTLFYLSCKKYKRIISVADSIIEEYVFGAKINDKTTTIGNPIDSSLIKKLAMDEDIKKDYSDIIFLGRLTKQKNPFFFLEIVRELVKEKKDLRVAMVGTGELDEKIRKKIEEFDISANIVMYEFQKNPYGLLQAAKIMCMPSLWEGFPVAAEEAMAFGKPVVAAPTGALKSIVTDRCGALCRDKEEYISEIRKLLNNPVYYEEKSKGAAERAETFYNTSSYSQKVKEIYESVIEDTARQQSIT